LTQKTPTRRLRELEGDGLIRRVVHPEIPPRVEYSPTEAGAEFAPILRAMNEWGKRRLLARSE